MYQFINTRAMGVKHLVAKLALNQLQVALKKAGAVIEKIPNPEGGKDEEDAFKAYLRQKGNSPQAFSEHKKALDAAVAEVEQACGEWGVTFTDEEHKEMNLSWVMRRSSRCFVSPPCSSTF